MQIINRIIVDLQRKALPLVHAMQNDAGTRAVKVVLYDGGVAWTPPDGVTVSLAYRKADKTAGWYDTLPDGSDACSVSGNEVTAVLAPQALTAAGQVNAVIVFQDASLNRLATFPFCVMVGADPSADTSKSNNYYKLQNLEQINDAMADLQQQLDDLVDDTVVSSAAAWSSKNVADKCCPSFTESGGIVACEPVEGYPLDVVTHIEPVQAGSGVPSPDNVRPITGWTGAKLWRGGKNMLPFPYPVDDAKIKEWTDNGVTRTINDDGSITLKGTATANIFHPQLAQLQTGLMGVKFNQYTFYDPSNGWHIVFINSGTTVDTTIYPQIEYGNVATAYEPYRGEDFAIDFGQTVYGGSMNWKTGVLTVDTVLTEIPPEQVRMANGSDIQYTTLDYLGAPHAVGGVDGLYCNRMKPASNVGNNDGQGTVIAVFDNGIVRFRNGVSTNQTEAQAWVAENPIQFAYKIAQPFTVQLTPQEILALSGINTLYSDTGDTTVNGRADPTAIIKDLYNKINALQAAAVNNA